MMRIIDAIMVANFASDRGEKIAYIEVLKVEILAKTTFETTVMEGAPYPTKDNLGSLNLVSGETYVVELNGIKYKCICAIAPMDGTSLYLGNLKFMGGDDTGEPFCLFSAGGYSPIMTEKADTHTIAIYQETEIVHPIDPKYLPSGWIDLMAYEGADTATIANQSIPLETAQKWVDLICSDNFKGLVINYMGTPMKIFATSTIYIEQEGVIMVQAFCRYDLLDSEGQSAGFHDVDFVLQIMGDSATLMTILPRS
jgi:hypothetical protein